MPKIEDFISKDEIITALYKSVLGRQPDPVGQKGFMNKLKPGQLAAIVEDFINSEEYNIRAANRNVPGFVPMNYSKPMDVKSDASAGQLDMIWSHVAESWSKLGTEDPLWSVVTDTALKSSNRPAQEKVDDFYRGGLYDVEYFKAYLARAKLEISNLHLLAEYGCGVGRVTKWLAQNFRSVRAFDISPPHLKIAENHFQLNSIENVELVHVKQRSDLERLNGVDVFFSIIVLQHNPPPLIVDILARAFDGLNEGGVAFFQVPIYSKDYKFNITNYTDSEMSSKTMEMHFVPQRDILDLADAKGMRVLEIRNDHCIGMYDTAVSSTFLLQKKRAHFR